MHIPDGILPGSVCVGGYALAGGVTWYALRQIQRRPDPSADIPKASLMAAAFFVASSISVPVPPASVHLVMNGAMGAVLGYYAFPAILIGLFFQAIVIGHGGLTTIGVDAVMMGVPALLGHHIFQTRAALTSMKVNDRVAIAICGFAAGAIAVGLAALIFFGVVITTIPADFDVGSERSAITLLMIAHIPLMLIEGTFCAMLMLFLAKVKPEVLNH